MAESFGDEAWKLSFHERSLADSGSAHFDLLLWLRMHIRIVWRHFRNTDVTPRISYSSLNVGYAGLPTWSLNSVFGLRAVVLRAHTPHSTTPDIVHIIFHILMSMFLGRGIKTCIMFSKTTNLNILRSHSSRRIKIMNKALLDLVASLCIWYYLLCPHVVLLFTGIMPTLC